MIAETSKNSRSTVLVESRVNVGKLLQAETGNALQRPRETCEGFRGPLSQP